MCPFSDRIELPPSHYLTKGFFFFPVLRQAKEATEVLVTEAGRIS